MKGREGDADANNNNEITAGGIYGYFETNVIQQLSGLETPELQGAADGVLLRFKYKLLPKCSLIEGTRRNPPGSSGL